MHSLRCQIAAWKLTLNCTVFKQFPYFIHFFVNVILLFISFSNSEHSQSIYSLCPGFRSLSKSAHSILYAFTSASTSWLAPTEVCAFLYGIYIAFTQTNITNTHQTTTCLFSSISLTFRIITHTPKQKHQLLKCTVLAMLGTAVAQLVEALHYKSAGRGFDSRWCHWNFSLT